MATEDHTLNAIEKKLSARLKCCGMVFHIFSRMKTPESINTKLNIKAAEYREKNKKMQDLWGLRITLYFSDDVEIIHQYLRSQPNFVDESVDVAEVDRFCPQRLNVIMRVPDEYKRDMHYAISQTSYPDLIDDTYEIQIRTIFSEGWHEVEHDLRYKCKEDWEDYKEESRLLNGIYATLESAEWAMIKLFERISYMHYKKRDWTSMIRSKMRLRFKDKSLSPELVQYFANNKEIAKRVFRVNRDKAIRLMIEEGFSFPLTYDTAIFILNHTEKIDKGLADMADPTLLKELNSLFGKF